MKAITLYQPWASLVAVGAKTFETRGWQTSYRGQLAIQAGKKKPSDSLRCVEPSIIKVMCVALGIRREDMHENISELLAALDKLPRGKIVCQTELIGCWHTFGRSEIICSGILKGARPGRINHFVSNDELIFGDFSHGRFAWELENIKKLPEPIPVRGKQGLWEWDEVGLR